MPTYINSDLLNRHKFIPIARIGFSDRGGYTLSVRLNWSVVIVQTTTYSDTISQLATPDRFERIDVALALTCKQLYDINVLMS